MCTRGLFLFVSIVVFSLFTFSVRAGSLRDLVYKKTNDWTSEEKSSFKSQYAYCSDSSWVAPINLSYQFPYSQCQGGGTCSYFSNSGLSSAALGRLNPKIFRPRSDKLGTSKVDTSKEGLLPLGFHTDFMVLNRLLETNSKDIKAAWEDNELMIRAWGCEKIDQLDLAKSIIGSESSRQIASELLCESGKCLTLPARKVPERKLTQELNLRIMSLCKEKFKKGQALSSEDIKNILVDLRDEWIEDKSVDNSPKILGEIEKAKARLLRHVLSPKMVSESMSSSQKSCDDSADSVKAKENVLKLVRSYLCAGIPLRAGIQMNSVQSKFESSNDGGLTFVPRSKPSTSAHSLVITGIYTHGPSKKEYIEFRNSWSNGDSSNPDASIARIPVAEACKLFDLEAFVSEDDKARLKLAGANLKSKSESKTYDYEEIIPEKKQNESRLAERSHGNK